MFVKICGITNEDDALLATALGADAVGFVFAPSRRQVKPDDVRDIVKRLPHDIVTIGVFRDERPERVVEIVGARRVARRAAPRQGAVVRGALGARATPVRHPGVRGRRSRARGGRERTGRRDPRRLAESRFGQGVRLATRRGRARWHAPAARGWAHTRERRRRDQARAAVGCRRVVGVEAVPARRIRASCGGSSKPRRPSTPRPSKAARV